MLGRRVFPYKDAVRYGFSPVGWHPMGQNEITFQEVLKEAGYVTAMVSDVPHLQTPGMNFHKGFHSFQFIRGQEGDLYVSSPSRQDPNEYMDPKASGNLMQNYFEQYLRNVDDRRSEEDYFAPQVFRRAEKWLQKNAGTYEKFFLYVDSFDPHEPWDPPKEYVELYDPGYKGKEYIFPQNGPCDDLSDKEIKHIQAMYAGEVTMVDRWFGHFMEKVEQMGLIENTAILFLSDHGLQLGDRGLMKKTPQSLYTEIFDIPMMLLMPGYSDKRKRIDGFILECDIAPTMLKLLGLEPPVSMNGLDFWPLVSGEKAWIRDYVSGSYHLWAYVQDKRFHYLRNLLGEPTPQLYDLEKDPAMLHDIINENTEAAKIMEDRLIRELDGWLPSREFVGKRIYERPYVPYKEKAGF
jgi:arylsulfatase A-like enzyme